MIMTSLLDTDLYKLTMMQGVLHQFPGTQVEYQFKCRNDNIDLHPIANEIKREINHLCQLRFTPDELRYLRRLRYFKADFIQFLKLFQLNENFVKITATDNQFNVNIEGPWLHTILFEVPVLSIINEIYFKIKDPEPNFDLGEKKLFDKIDLIQRATKENIPIKFCDFGTRRRFSNNWQEHVVRTLKTHVPTQLIGTSNVLLAMKYNLMPIGTMAHEWLMAAQALGPRLIDSQKSALESWVKEYRGDLGIALSDVVGFDAFLKDFDLYFAKLFDGCRHDSGDPFEWGEKLIKHYKSLNIDPKTKTMVFSDGLTIPKMIELAKHFNDRVNTSFGVGTNLTNDITLTPLQIVIKMTKCQDSPVAKISDSPGKQMCTDQQYLEYLKAVFNIH